MARPLSIECDSALRVALDVRSLRLNDEQFYRLCGDNPDIRLELTAKGELIVMPPTYAGSGWRDSRINQRLANWTEADGTGICFGSSTGFTLPNGAKRSPDASWMPLSRWNSLNVKEQDETMPQICPDFVVELRSRTDALKHVQEKMLEYIQNGARLGWLLDPMKKRAYVYRHNHLPECIKEPGDLSGEDVLPGFRFNFNEIV